MKFSHCTQAETVQSSICTGETVITVNFDPTGARRHVNVSGKNAKNARDKLRKGEYWGSIGVDGSGDKRVVM